MYEAVRKKYLIYSEEPIHIGERNQFTDNSTARDVDGFPYIPASSLKGSVRFHSSTIYGVEGCDGKGWECPQPHKCASCAVFGYSNFHQGSTAASLVRFSSASLVLIPFSSESGTFWVTSGERLFKAGITRLNPINEQERWFAGEQIKSAHINSLVQKTRSPLDTYKQPNHQIESIATFDWNAPYELKRVFPRSIIVDEGYLSSMSGHFVGSSTSVSIDSKTGNARPGALFSIEYINQKSILSFEVTFINPMQRGLYQFINTKQQKDGNLKADIDNMSQIINDGLHRLEFYGIGGKRSRGFGNILTWEQSTDKALQYDAGQTYKSHNTQRPLVFISYTSQDKNIARRLAGDLQLNNFDPWLDDIKILVGDSIHAKVEEGLRACDFLVVLISRKALDSAWVKEELNAILAREKLNKEIIMHPVMLDDISPEELPTYMQDRKYTIFHKNYANGLQQLINTLHLR